MNIIKVIISELGPFLKGAWIAIQLLCGLIVLGFVVGLGMAVLEVFGNTFIRSTVSAIRKVLWAIPKLVLLSVVFYLPFNLDSMTAAIIALGLSSASFQSQIFRGAIQAINPGQLMAARAMGLGIIKTIRFVIIPQMIRLSIGAWTNEFATELKDTSLAFVVGVVELMRQAQYIVAYTFGNAAPVYAFVAVIYFTMTRTGTFIFYRLERKLWVPGFERRSG